LGLLCQWFEDRKLLRTLGEEPYAQWKILGLDLASNWPKSFRSFAWVFELKQMSLWFGLRGLVALSLLFGQSIEPKLQSASIIVLWISQLLWMIRWRGALNGGSDLMTLSLLNGLVLGEACSLGLWLAGMKPSSIGHQVSLWFIVIQSLSSYVVSGAVKLRDAAWRNGSALIHFLDNAVYGPLKSKSLFRRQRVAMLVSWSFILWECAMPLLLLHPMLAKLACLTALVFHSLVFTYFGLNRFFWAWSSCFPALIYAAYALQATG
jgi:hypothetical protein